MTELEEKARMLLKLPVKDAEDADRLEALGVPKRSRSNAMLLTAMLLEKAKNGDAAALKELRALTAEENGQDPGGDDGALADLIRGLMEGGTSDAGLQRKTARPDGAVAAR